MQVATVGVAVWESRDWKKESELRKRSCSQIVVEWDFPSENCGMGVAVWELLSGPWGSKSANC